MEKFLGLLPERPQPAMVRYAVSAGMTVLAGVGVILLHVYSGQVFYIVLLPPIFLSGIIFDRGSSFVATAVGAALGAYLLWPMPASSAEYVSLLIFVLVGIAAGFTSEAMRKLLERLVAAERQKDIALRELMHRTKNNLMSIASLLMMQSRAATSDEATAALGLAADRVNVIADVHDFLSVAGEGRVSMQDYLEELCHKVGYSARGARPIAMKVDAADVQLLERKAVPIAIIVNELITNCFKYAFPESRVGTIWVRLTADDRQVHLEVKDDGVGCPNDAKPGLGTKLIEVMVRQLGGSIERKSPEAGGCRVGLTFPRSQMGGVL